MVGGVIDTDDKLVSGVIDTGDKLAGGVIDTDDKLVSGVLFDTKQKNFIGVMGTGDRGSAVFIEEPATNLSVIYISEKWAAMSWTVARNFSVHLYAWCDFFSHQSRHNCKEMSNEIHLVNKNVFGTDDKNKTLRQLSNCNKKHENCVTPASGFELMLLAGKKL